MTGARRRARLGAAVLWTLLIGCDGANPSTATPADLQLALLVSHRVDVEELSGLSLDVGGSRLWAVGGRRIYRLSLDGQVQKRLDFAGDNLEGIAYDPADSTLWVVEEKRREILHLDLDGGILGSYRLDLTGPSNSGLEGICVDADGRLRVVNEKNPVLLLSLGPELDISVRSEIPFADDLSGMDCGKEPGRFWLVSDQSQTLYSWEPGAGLLGAATLPFKKAEGVAVNADARLAYVASESEKRLYIYSFALPE